MTAMSFIWIRNGGGQRNGSRSRAVRGRSIVRTAEERIGGSQTRHDHANDIRWLAERFEEHRGRLGALAYRMLGSLGDAEDAVQEAWLRLSRSDAGEIENLGGWLTTVVARVCLNMLEARGSAARSRWARTAGARRYARRQSGPSTRCCWPTRSAAR